MKSGKQVHRGLLSPFRDKPNQAYLDAQSEKFSVPLSEMDMEKFVHSITPRAAQKEEYIEIFINNYISRITHDVGYNDADKKARITAANLWKMNILQEKIEKEVDKDFAVDFYLWLQGRGKDHDHQRTPWGRTKIRDEECLDYIQMFLEAKIDFQQKLFKLSQAYKLGPLQGVNEHYLFFKYIVRNSPDLDSSEFLKDYNLFYTPAPKFGNHQMSPDDHGHKDAKIPKTKYEDRDDKGKLHAYQKAIARDMSDDIEEHIEKIKDGDQKLRYQVNPDFDQPSVVVVTQTNTADPNAAQQLQQNVKQAQKHTKKTSSKTNVPTSLPAIPQSPTKDLPELPALPENAMQGIQFTGPGQDATKDIAEAKKEAELNQLKLDVEQQKKITQQQLDFAKKQMEEDQQKKDAIIKQQEEVLKQQQIQFQQAQQQFQQQQAIQQEQINRANAEKAMIAQKMAEAEAKAAHIAAQHVNVPVINPLPQPNPVEAQPVIQPNVQPPTIQPIQSTQPVLQSQPNIQSTPTQPVTQLPSQQQISDWAIKIPDQPIPSSNFGEKPMDIEKKPLLNESTKMDISTPEPITSQKQDKYPNLEESIKFKHPVFQRRFTNLLKLPRSRNTAGQINKVLDQTKADFIPLDDNQARNIFELAKNAGMAMDNFEGSASTDYVSLEGYAKTMTQLENYIKSITPIVDFKNPSTITPSHKRRRGEEEQETINYNIATKNDIIRNKDLTLEQKNEKLGNLSKKEFEEATGGYTKTKNDIMRDKDLTLDQKNEKLGILSKVFESKGYKKSGVENPRHKEIYDISFNNILEDSGVKFDKLDNIKQNAVRKYAKKITDLEIEMEKRSKGKNPNEIEKDVEIGKIYDMITSLQGKIYDKLQK